MKWEEVLGDVAEQGAIRVWSVSKGWALVYRLRKGRWEARNIVKVGADEWMLTDKVVGSQNVSRDGWTAIARIHHRSKPIESAQAEKNKGYFFGLERRCETCKLMRSSAEFDRLNFAEGGFRTWECNYCAEERRRELGSYREQKRVGDVLRRETHASRPPVESEI